MTESEEKRFHDLVVKECFLTITTREMRELNRLQRVRHKEIDAEMDITCPGWRKRELALQRKINRMIRKLEAIKENEKKT
jgi:hypothetical protein